MAKIKIGAEVKSIADLQNLVTGVIFRQTTEFSVEDIYSMVIDKLQDFENFKSADVKNICQKTVDKLFNCDCLKRVGVRGYRLHMSFPALMPKESRENKL